MTGRHERRCFHVVLVSALALLGFITPARPALAQCANAYGPGSPSHRLYPIDNHTCIDLIDDSGGKFDDSDLIYAKGQFGACSGAGSTIPDINIGNSG